VALLVVAVVVAMVVVVVVLVVRTVMVVVADDDGTSGTGWTNMALLLRCLLISCQLASGSGNWR